MTETPFTADPVPLDATITTWEHHQAQVDHFIQQHFQEGSDYHIMKGKPSLGKAGAEKLATLFHLRATFTQDTATRAMMGDEPGLLCYLCVLYTLDNQVFAEGRGARRLSSDPDDPNKTVKMAQKSAMIDAVLRGLALSGRYTQDMEDAPAQPPVPPTAPVGTWRSVVPGEVYATALQKNTLPSGTIFYKVLSDDFPPRYSTGKYPGVVIWENALKASGIDVEALQAGIIPDIAGWRVEWEEYKDKDGKDRQRVNRLFIVHQVPASTEDIDDSDIPF